MTSTDEAAFLAAIRAEPACDTARLVYADWLQENGDEVRAVYIRDAIRLPRPHEFPEGCAAAVIVYGAVHGSVVLAPPHPNLAWTVSRGFVEEVRCPADVWIRRADQILREYPVRKVRLTTVPLVTGDSVAWRLMTDPEQRTFSEDAVQREMSLPPKAHANGRWLAALLRLRWPGVDFEFVPLTVTVMAGASATLQIDPTTGAP